MCATLAKFYATNLLLSLVGLLSSALMAQLQAAKGMRAQCIHVVPIVPAILYVIVLYNVVHEVYACATYLFFLFSGLLPTPLTEDWCVPAGSQVFLH